MNHKLTQENVTESRGKWIIFSMSATGASMAAFPQLHNTHPAALNECERLAALDSSKIFMPVQITGGCRKQNVVWY